MTLCLSPGQAHDAPEGRRLLKSLSATSRPVHLLMDRAHYEGNETRQLALDLGYISVVPPLKTRIEPWEYNREMYKRRSRTEDVNAIDADVTILAGDIGIGLSGLQWALTFEHPVIYVLGNHEFYGQKPMETLLRKARGESGGNACTSVE